MTCIPETHRKLREAKFFHAHLVERKGKVRQMQHIPEMIDDMEKFGFYVSAFLSAGRSVTLVLQNEQKELYDA